MKHKDLTEVLIVGAGPAGMMTGILLAEAGIDFHIIDEASGTAAQSCACGLHSNSLKLLDKAGLLRKVFEAGHRIETIAFYDGTTRVAEVRPKETKSEPPHALALPQGTLESLLETRLQQIRGDRIFWNHRLSKLEPGDAGGVATIDQLEMSAVGYGVPQQEWTVKNQLKTEAAFVVGADGRDSIVKKSTTIPANSLQEGEHFMLCDTKHETGLPHEVRVSFADDKIGVFWPFSETSGRWILQTGASDQPADFPVKDRKPLIMPESPREQSRFEELIQTRAPWFTRPVKEIDWQVEATFEPALAERFGDGRWWLTGDAVRQGDPVGMQSMNAGLTDAADLTEALTNILRENAPLTLLEVYARSRRGEWQNLYSSHLKVQPGALANSELKKNWKRIPTSLPALGRDLTQLLRQLGAKTGRASRQKAAHRS